MKYTVRVVKAEKFENQFGVEVTDEVEIKTVKQSNASLAQAKAEELAKEYEGKDGDYRIYVHYLHHDSPCYLNP